MLLTFLKLHARWTDGLNNI